MATLADIAAAVGVRPSTVSVVLNGKTTKIKVSQQTQKKIFDVARQLNYEPNGVARALISGRTGYLGFILSEQITDGWANAFYGEQLMGVEQRCRELGYGLSISRYNLTNIDQFIFPLKVRQRNVDALVLAGSMDVAVVNRFQEWGVPCVTIGVSSEIASRVPSITANDVATKLEAVTYAYGLGHRRMGMVIDEKQRMREVTEAVCRRVRTRAELGGCEVRILQLPHHADWAGGQDAYDIWSAMPPQKRPTLLMGSDKVMAGYLKAAKAHGYRCPEDISLISYADTRMCDYLDPPLTAISFDLRSFGRLAVELLVNHLEHGQSLDPGQSIVDPKCKLVVRDSCGPAPLVPSDHPVRDLNQSPSFFKENPC